jgi:hypothetical protein
MALDGFILKKGQVVLTQDIESASGMAAASSAFTYGYVEKVNDLSDLYKVGDYVLFMTSEAFNFTYYEEALTSLVNYSLTTEDKLFLIEPYFAP